MTLALTPYFTPILQLLPALDTPLRTMQADALVERAAGQHMKTYGMHTSYRRHDRAHHRVTE